MIIEKHMTPFRKEERYGYNIYQSEQKQFFFDLDPPIPLSTTMPTRHHIA